MWKVSDYLPPSKKIGCIIMAILCAGLHFFLALIFVVGSFKAARVINGVFLGAVFIFFAYRAWYLRYWVYQGTCAVMLCVSCFSIWWFFPTYQDTMQVQSSAIPQLILLVVIPILFAGYCYFYNKEFIREY
jgi:hypothetical protein